MSLALKKIIYFKHIQKKNNNKRTKFNTNCVQRFNRKIR